MKSGYKIAKPITALNPETGEYAPLNSELLDLKSREVQMLDL